ncbi:hypothetical protein AB0M23_28515 [Streptomyces sp. NPDC052077]|uniref:hypothetical protein n=1 Tax=Streptomyces sp. NPDC052077 TaxID=3154757 RepID=UPI00341B778E
MMPPVFHQHAATAGAVLCAAAAFHALVRGQAAVAVLFGLGVLVLAEAAFRERRRLRRARLECAWAQRRALGQDPAPLDPCCLLARHSNGRAHDRKCTGDHSLAGFIAEVEADYGEPR